MIEFYGILSNECKIARAKKISKKNGLVFLLSTIILGLVVLPIGIVKGLWYYSLGIVLVLVIVTIIAFIVPKRKILNIIIPSYVKINMEFIEIAAVLGNGKNIRKMSRVKKVVDCGTWYEIFFKFGDITNSCVCQKNLIVLGTIEEFEKLFEGKIIRKLK